MKSNPIISPFLPLLLAFSAMHAAGVETRHYMAIIFSAYPTRSPPCPPFWTADAGYHGCCKADEVVVPSVTGTDGQASPACCHEAVSCTGTAPVMFDWTTDGQGYLVILTGDAAETSTAGPTATESSDSPNTTDANAQPTTTPVDDDQDTSNNNDDDDEEHTTHPNETNDGAIPTATDDSGNISTSASSPTPGGNGRDGGDSSSNNGGDGSNVLGVGAIAGIVVSCVCSVIGLIFGIWFRFYKLKRKERIWRETMMREQRYAVPGSGPGRW